MGALIASLVKRWAGERWVELAPCRRGHHVIDEEAAKNAFNDVRCLRCNELLAKGWRRGAINIDRARRPPRLL